MRVMAVDPAQLHRAAVDEQLLVLHLDLPEADHQAHSLQHGAIGAGDGE
ncbi:MAG: hypothetical protein BWY76_03048 [bacterium ADurb.Bin429]|nr:MAG: hypothetical protein BWY76_03048 [bacterium ADurb.Bin429]